MYQLRSNTVLILKQLKGGRKELIPGLDIIFILRNACSVTSSTWLLLSSYGALGTEKIGWGLGSGVAIACGGL